MPKDFIALQLILDFEMKGTSPLVDNTVKHMAVSCRMHEAKEFNLMQVLYIREEPQREEVKQKPKFQ